MNTVYFISRFISYPLGARIVMSKTAMKPSLG